VQVVAAIKSAGNCLKLRLVTPLNRANTRSNYTKNKVNIFKHF
jgi:hypothetical protein